MLNKPQPIFPNRPGLGVRSSDAYGVFYCKRTPPAQHLGDHDVLGAVDLSTEKDNRQRLEADNQRLRRELEAVRGTTRK